MARITEIEGIGPANATKLAEAGIKRVEDLLNRAATPADRQALSAATGIAAATLLEWANRADLFRIRGIGEQYSDLLEAAGVDTVPELARRKAENLIKKLTEVNAASNLVRKLPTVKQVADWIGQAADLPRKLEY